MRKILSIVCLKLSLNSVIATSQTFVLSSTFVEPLRISGRYANGPILEWEIDFVREPTILLSNAPVSGSVELIAEDETILTIDVYCGPVERRPEHYNHYGPRIALTHRSVFGRNLQNAVFLPRGEGHIMKTNVQNFSESCQSDSPIQYVPMTRIGVVFSINLVDQQSSEILPIDSGRTPGTLEFTTLDARSKSRIPRTFFEHIQSEVMRIGCSEDALISLPLIEYSSRNGVSIYMYPHDYVVDVDGECQLLIDRSYDGYTWGKNMLQNLGVMIDFENLRWGICDPQ